MHHEIPRSSSRLSLAMLFFLASVPALAADDDGVLRPEFTASLRNSLKLEGANRAPAQRLKRQRRPPAGHQPGGVSRPRRTVQPPHPDQGHHRPEDERALLDVRLDEHLSARRDRETQARRIRVLPELLGVLGQAGEGQFLSGDDDRAARSRSLGPRIRLLRQGPDQRRRLLVSSPWR